MSAIPDMNEPWAGHSGLEVETFLKNQIRAALAASGGKIGYVEMVGMDLKFYENEGDQNPLYVISLGGDVYNISVVTDPGQVFYILADETEKIISFTPSTTVSEFGSTVSEPFPENYTYVVSVNTGNGYVPRITGGVNAGGTATVDIRPYIATGDNYIRIAVTGLSSGQTKTVVLTGTLTTLTMSCNHAWQNVWQEGSYYVITGIRFAGSLEKYLHIALDGTEFTPVRYSSGQSYTTTSTTYTMPASAFPASSGSGIHTVTLWMTAQGVSTPVSTYYIMCAAEDDNTPMVAINSITPVAMNFTSETLFGYAVYKADKAVFNLSAAIGGQTYTINQEPISISGREEGERYTFAYPLEIDTGVNEATTGTLTATATPYYGNVSGSTHTVTTVFDNTYSYLATPGALFYLNAATRDNGQSNYQTIINEMGPSQDGKFAASYTGTWSGFSWNGDGWIEEKIQTAPNTYATTRALSVPAGASLVVNNFAPLSLLASYPNGFTIEMMLKCGNPSVYTNPVFSMYSNGNGIRIYPTKIEVMGTSERSEVLQSVNLAETTMTHLTITFTKNYEGVSSRNLVSIYVNGISNVNFAFDGGSSFGNGNFTIGQQDTDAFLYKMRIYGFALEPQAVFNNFLNCIVDGVEFNRRETYKDNQVLDGGVVDYAACKEAGFNTMVVIMDSDSHDIPSFNNQASYDGCSLKFEYADDPTKNVYVQNVSLDGQGTTSKQYYRWNLRAKTGSSTVWTYADGTSETGKEGYMAGTGYARVDRITAKKNYASSMQGHKMGFTGLYNDLFVELGLNDNLPNPNYRVAVYQFPFVGFRYIAGNDTYEFIGIYTAGPDKGSKKTFGYASSYDHLLSLEGPNHAPRGTRFLHPWVDVTYSYQDETLKFGGEEGWDCDYVGAGLSSDKSSDAAAILSLYNSEFKDAYNIVFNCSPYIAPISDTGYASIAAINAALTTFLPGTTDGVSNQILSFYDASYELYFYRTSTGTFVKLSDVDSTLEHNVVTYLYSNGYLSTQSPSRTQLIAARAARFKAEMGNYWDVDQTLYHYCFCILFGVTDNFAKNTYPFKFLPCSASGAGNRWGWRQDDLDTVLMTDNNGRNTKSYSVEHGDLFDGAELFQGGNSALWVLIRDNYATEVRNMMADLANAASSIATSLGIQGDGLHGSLFNLTSYYCWEHSAKYFAATLYENDRRWSYIEPWLINASATYNNVPPLTQALGDQYQAEKLWMERRIAYIFSKYEIGAFTGDTAGYGRMEFTLARSYTFSVTPAIDLYPVISLANTSDNQGGRTTASQSTSIYVDMQGSSDTTVYIHGADWLASIGDVSDMRLSPRAGSPDIAFSVNGARIQSLKIGDATAGNVVFNATTFSVTSPTITSIDARNTTTITNSVDLLNCPRLRTVKFAGSGATGLILPVGAKLTEVSFPSNAAMVFMHSLPYLTAANLTLPSLANIYSLYVNNCPAINPLELIEDILDTTGNTLEYATLIWKGTLVADASDMEALDELTGKSGYVDFQNGSPTIVAGTPWLEGTISSTISMPASEYTNVESSFPKVTFDFDLTKIYIDFADSAVESICLSHWDSNSSGVLTLDEARAVTSLSTYFRSNTSITTFNELRFFTGLTIIYGVSNSTGAFQGCTALTSVRLPDTVTIIGQYAFSGATALASINLENITELRSNCFQNASALAIDLNMPNLTTMSGNTHFYNSGIKKIISLGSVTSFAGGSTSSGPFGECSSLTEVTLPSTLITLGDYSFRNCSNLTTVYSQEGLTTIGSQAFINCTSLATANIPTSVTFIGTSAFNNTALTGELNLPNLTSLGATAFKGTRITKIRSLGSITSIASGGGDQGMFQGCTYLTEVTLSSTLTLVGSYAFYGCSSLQTVTGLGTTEIGSEAFYNCASLSSINLSNVTAIGANAFRYDALLTDVSTAATTIGGSAFRDCTNINRIILPNIQTISEYAFAESKKGYIEIGANCTSIAGNAFVSSSNATYVADRIVICRATTPPTLGANNFRSYYNGWKYDCSIYVPYSADHSILNAYKAASNWSQYASTTYELDEDGNIPT